MVAAQHIATMHSAQRNRQDQIVHDEAQCVLRLVDREILAVREGCSTIRGLMDGPCRQSARPG
jgi:hypothetical protein